MASQYPTQNVSARLAAVNPVYATEEGGVFVDTGTWNAAASAELQGIPKATEANQDVRERPFPQVGDNFDLRINSDLLLACEVEESGRNGDGSVSITGFSAERRLNQTTISPSYDETPAVDVIREAFNAAGVTPLEQCPFPTDDILQETLPDELVPDTDPDDTAPEGVTITADFDATCAVIVQVACLQSDFVWRVTADGQGFFGSPLAIRQARTRLAEDRPDTEPTGDPRVPPGDDVDEDPWIAAPFTWPLRYIVADGTTPASQRASFDLVQVVGSPTEITSSGAPRAITDPTVAELTVSEPPDGRRPRAHRYVDPAIKSQINANAVATALWREVRRQRSAGMIRMVGDTRLRPGDSARMLPELSQDASDPDFYHIRRVRHLINGSDGFLTEIDVAAYEDSEPPEPRTELTPTAFVTSGTDQDLEGPETDDAEGIDDRIE
jgi:hypothetical protein